jgi:hypothetical protein
MASHPLLDQLDIDLRDRVPAQPVDFAGEWSTRSRRTYATDAQLGTGPSPFMDVVDRQWRGALTCAEPMGAVAFLLASGNLFWVKSRELSATLPVEVSLHAWADYRPDRATFAAVIGGAYLPGVPVLAAPDVAGSCTVEPGTIRTGRVTCLARANPAALFVLLIPRRLLRMGRKRVWRVRDGVVASLPTGIPALLTRGRTGSC